MALNGQANAEKVLIGLMKSSLFVEEAKITYFRTQAAFPEWLEGGNLPREILEEMFTQPFQPQGPIVEQLLPHLRGYLDAYLDQYTHSSNQQLSIIIFSRFNQLDFLDNVQTPNLAKFSGFT